MGRKIYFADSEREDRLSFFMELTETELDGVLIVQLNPAEDERGFYKRLWGKENFENLGLESNLDNIGISYNKKRGTVRGMHYQNEPFAETKIVQCIRGKIFDVILDIRRNSKTFGRWISIELNCANHQAVYIPKGMAHGFQTLENDSELLYLISSKYNKNSAKGVRWNDKKFGIEFPIEISAINERDANYTDFE